MKTGDTEMSSSNDSNEKAIASAMLCGLGMIFIAMVAMILTYDESRKTVLAGFMIGALLMEVLVYLAIDGVFTEIVRGFRRLRHCRIILGGD